MKDIVVGDLNAAFDESDARAVRVRLTGKSSSRDAGKVLAPIFDQALESALAGHRGLELRFERLEYFNSSTIAALVQFIRTAQEKNVALTVFYDPSLKWQAMSFDALKRAMRPVTGGGAAVVFATERDEPR